MLIRSTQRGVGMMEVLISLLILAIAVLGFVALQVRAVASTSDAVQKVDAMNLARDLAERIRANRDAYSTYLSLLNATTQSTTASTICLGSTTCTSVQMANYDSAEVLTRAKALGMTMAMPACQVSGTVARQCVYVAWGKTTATNGTASTDCTNSGAYVPTAQCVIMELY